jgi:anti-sigma regulatory factor (Ser/Thr protein kinase)
MTGVSAGPGEVLVRFPTHPHSVRTARSLAGDTLRAWDLAPLVDDALLLVSELATNATLHSGARTFALSVAATAGGGVRIAVGDDGPVPAAAVVRRSRPPGHAPSRVRPETTTGRGLGIVEELASSWGVRVDGATKWVWFELSSPGAQTRPEQAPVAAAAQAPLPPGWHLVQLVDCPVALSLAQDDHLDELVRELQLLGARHDEPELAPLIRGILDGQAQARHMGRRTAQEAAAAGREHVTVVMVLPSPAAEQVERLDEAVAAADALCEREQLLLTLASPPEVRAVRTWMRDEVRDQIRHARPPRSYDAWRTAQDGGAVAHGPE